MQDQKDGMNHNIEECMLNIHIPFLLRNAEMFTIKIKSILKLLIYTYILNWGI